MLHVLTEDEYQISKRQDYAKTNHWWENLSLRERKMIYEYHKDILKQMVCEHRWRETRLYNDPILQCLECHLTIDGGSGRFVITEKIK